MSVVVVATVRPVRAEREAVVAAFRRAVARVHVEDEGCELYALHENDDHLVMIEKWTSAEALDVHSRSAAVKELDAAVAGRLLIPTDVQSYTAVPAGDAAKGAL